MFDGHKLINRQDIAIGDGVSSENNIMETISFTRMDQGTAEEYVFLDRLAEEHRQAHLADNLIGLLKSMQGPTMGYLVDRFEHSLQTATRALRDEADEETVVAALLHDIGDVYAPDNHSAFAAAVLKPYVSERTHWVVKHHGLFQGYYFFHHLGLDRDGREQFRGHPISGLHGLLRALGPMRLRPRLRHPAAHGLRAHGVPDLCAQTTLRRLTQRLTARRTGRSAS